MSKILVAYFTCSGNTKRFAEEIAKTIDGELYEIKPKVPYTEEDLNWMNENSRSTLEMKDLDYRPEIEENELEISKYETIYIGYPIWWGKAPTIINTFLEKYDLANKTLIPFGIYHSSGIGESDKYLIPSCKNSNYVNAKGFQMDKIEEVKKWLKKEGE